MRIARSPGSWQPAWHARRKYLHKLRHGASLKKKTAVALARQLAIDLLALENGSRHCGRTGLDLAYFRRCDPRTKELLNSQLLQNAISRQNSIWPQGGALLDAAAGPQRIIA
jgi:hypothetical protein